MMMTIRLITTTDVRINTSKISCALWCQRGQDDVTSKGYDMITTVKLITKENWHSEYELSIANKVSIGDHNKMITITTIVKKIIYSLLPTRSRLMSRQ